MVEIHVERTIAASPDRVFQWLTDPANLTAAPLFLKASWRKDSLPPGVGAVREVIAAGAWLREEVTGYEPPRAYSYRVIRSFPAARHEGGTVSVAPADLGSQVEWATDYTIPLRGGGKLMEAVTSPVFRSCFDAILRECATALE